ncbi:MAG TPA: V-type ATP synthase subunit E [Archaeoglobaceae archaeon]|nr:V-type ATP synthase subunit E [Archaeoglobaceae archaeon]
MALEVVVEEIQKRGSEQAKEILDNAKAEAEKITGEAKEKANEILKKGRNEGESEAERLKRQEISSLNLEMKRLLLNKRKEIIEEVYSIVEERVKSMSADEKKRLLNTLITKNAEEGSVVYSNKDDEPIVKEIISENVKYGGNIECIGGVIIESLGGTVRLNLTFDGMLKQLYEQKMGEVSKMLFGE